MTIGDSIQNPTNLNLARLQDDLTELYRINHRHFPWRETKDAYSIFISEVMSQQTQLSRITAAWDEFLSIWPSVESLANSNLSDVLTFWTSHRLGYNRRARFLREAAIKIVQQFDGEFPRSVDLLQTLPGIGPYTANAIASFAFNTGGPTLDTNVKRVLHRAFGPFDNASDMEQLANHIMPQNNSRIWNNSLMELGAITCKTIPLCDLNSCPWKGNCNAYSSQNFSIPVSSNSSTFKGSDRQIRGEIINILSKRDFMTLSEIDSHLFSSMPPQYNSNLLPPLLSSLESDGLIQLDMLDQISIVRLPR